VLFGVTVLFVSVVCPLTFLYIQRYKNKINGPWDEVFLVLALALSVSLSVSLSVGIVRLVA